MRAEISSYINIANSTSRLPHPFAEVVIHDLEKDQIAAIFSPISKREVGNSSYLDRIDFSLKSKKDSR